MTREVKDVFAIWTLVAILSACVLGVQAQHAQPDRLSEHEAGVGSHWSAHAVWPQEKRRLQ